MNTTTIGTITAQLVANAARHAPDKSVDGVARASSGAVSELWAWLREHPRLEQPVTAVAHGADGDAQAELARAVDAEVAGDDAGAATLTALAEAAAGEIPGAMTADEGVWSNRPAHF